MAQIKKHFFKDINDQIKRVKDSRHQGYILYDLDIPLFTVILKNICNIKSMRGMTEGFNKDECIENISKVLDLDDLNELPHYDTINDFLSEMEVSELEHIR
ncbi:MAG TPA: transposase family protein [Clostridia bacterium]|nr:transposase family protein [Clostridia bacterium]